MLKLQDLNVQGKRVLLRVDFNVPLAKDGSISDDTRMREALPTIEYILKHGGSVILMSHLGRPKGKKDPQFTLAPLAKHLSQLLHLPVKFCPDCIGPIAETMTKEMKPGEVLLLENLRFYPAEEDPDSDPTFAKKLAKLGDCYVNDAFGTAHRKHSSTATIAQYFTGKKAMGLLMQREVAFFTELLQSPKRPFYALIGGSKISTKFGMLRSLLSRIDGILIGGAMAYTLLKAQGVAIGDSLIEDNFLQESKQFLKEAAAKKISVWLPVDHVIADSFSNDASIKICSNDEGIPSGWRGMDIGPETISQWKIILEPAKTIFWNGPLGVFEMPHFKKGTEEIAKTLSESSAMTVVGGGDSIAAINQFHLSKKFTHLSTGGGASLEFLEFGRLPGIDALQ